MSMRACFVYCIVLFDVYTVRGENRELMWAGVMQKAHKARRIQSNDSVALPRRYGASYVQWTALMDCFHLTPDAIAIEKLDSTSSVINFAIVKQRFSNYLFLWPIFSLA